jgi:hypothetical protein
MNRLDTSEQVHITDRSRTSCSAYFSPDRRSCKMKRSPRGFWSQMQVTVQTPPPTCPPAHLPTQRRWGTPSTGSARSIACAFCAACAAGRWLRRNWLPLLCVISAAVGLAIALAGIIKPCEPTIQLTNVIPRPMQRRPPACYHEPNVSDDKTPFFFAAENRDVQRQL